MTTKVAVYKYNVDDEGMPAVDMEHFDLVELTEFTEEACGNAVLAEQTAKLQQMFHYEGGPEIDPGSYEAEQVDDENIQVCVMINRVPVPFRLFCIAEGD